MFVANNEVSVSFRLFSLIQSVFISTQIENSDFGLHEDYFTA